MHLNSRPPTTVIPLRRHNHIIMLPCLQTRLLPRSKVVSNSHHALTPLILSHAENLPERRCPFNRRLVNAHLGSHRVDASIRREVGDNLTLGRRRGFVVWVVVFDDVVFDEGVSSPAVDGKVGVTVGLEGAGPVYGSCGVSSISGCSRPNGYGVEEKCGVMRTWTWNRDSNLCLLRNFRCHSR